MKRRRIGREFVVPAVFAFENEAELSRGRLDHHKIVGDSRNRYPPLSVIPLPPAVGLNSIQRVAQLNILRGILAGRYAFKRTQTNLTGIGHA
jgi:hypothetical protein